MGNSLTYRYILVRGLEEKCFLNMEVIFMAELASNKGDANRHAHDKGRYNTTQRVNYSMCGYTQTHDKGRHNTTQRVNYSMYGYTQTHNI